jgi:hypothetical protein
MLGTLRGGILLGLVLLLSAAASRGAGEMRLKTERFDRDPGWDGRNNRPVKPGTRPVRQDFGWSPTRHAAGAPGEIGGFVTPAAELAYYGKPLEPLTLEQPITASGVFFVPAQGGKETGGGNTLVGFFNTETLNEWRTPNSLVLRINGRGDGTHLHVEYCTSRWRAGGEFFGDVDPASGKKQPRLLPNGVPHRWSLHYDPAGNNGGGVVTTVVDGETLVMKLDPGHKADGARFNRFGILNVLKSADGGGSLWLDDLVINGWKETFDRDPQWDARGNRVSFDSTNVRPQFDFGYSRTHHAGGAAPGEMGGLIFRGDERSAASMAYYGDRTEELSLDHPLKSSGKLAFLRGVTDSTSMIGFFHSEGTMRVSTAQRSGFPENFLGAVIEGPSSQGFYFYPAYGTDREGETLDGFRVEPRGPEPPHLYPDGATHNWSLEYVPGAGKAGRITVTLDGKSVSLDVRPEHREVGARFNRFGIVTTHIDGNGQVVYYDDLTYTVAAPKQPR